MIDLDALLDAASLPERTVQVCVHGDLLAVLLDAEERYRETMERAVDDAALRAQLLPASQVEADVMDSLSAEVRPAQDAANAAQAAVKAAQVPFRLRAVPQHQWTSLIVQHPPRDGVAPDVDAGVNTDTFPAALLRLSLIDPVPTDEQWQKLLERLHLTELRRLTAAADTLSRRQGTLVPFSFGAFAPTPALDAKPKLPAD